MRAVIRKGWMIRAAMTVMAAAGMTAFGSVRQATAQSAAEALQALEQRLLAASPMVMSYRAQSQGAFDANLQGDLRLGNQSAGLRAQGPFGGELFLLHLDYADGRARGGNGEREFDTTDAAELEEALVFGLTRMGILHNLARLTGGAAPDHAAGGVDDWIQAGNPVWTDGDPDGPGPISTGIRFDVVVSGVPTAEATLWLDDEGLPRLRTQTVQFPDGVMEVLEEYDFQSAPGSRG